MDLIRSRGRGFSIAAALFLIVSCDKAPASQSAPAGARTSGSEPTVVATVGDRKITLADVDERAIKNNMTVFQQLYDLRREAVEQIVAEILLEQEAAKRGITKEELESQEIAAKTPAVTEKDIRDFYDQNRARIPADQTFEQLAGQIREYLALRNAHGARESFLSTLRAAANVDIALEAPRVPIQVADGERVKGPATAPVTIIEYSDFQ
jgi:hypothetical protein